ncbi:MAG: response regulator [Desulfamplus sp.]|nr:response regulator [Desulfamplus sp.]
MGVDSRAFAKQVIEILENGKFVDNPFVLIVEDSLTIAGILKRAFEAKGYFADIALTAKDAEVLFQTKQYDVAVIDYHLPDNMGDTLLELFHKKNLHCVSLIMTSDPNPSLALEWIKQGASAYIRKPFEPEYLIELCSRARRERALSSVQTLLETQTQELKKSEDELRKSEEKYRALVEGLPDVIMRFDREGRHLFVSDNVNREVDLNAEQFIGKTHKELGFPEELCCFWEAAIKEVFDSGIPFESEFSFIGKGGKEHIVNWRLLAERNSSRDIESVLSISRDITKHRKAERDYHTLFNEMLDGFALHEIICDDNQNPIDYKFLAVNPAFERMTSVKSYDIVGKRVLEVFPDTEKYWIEIYGKVALTGEPVFFENYSNQICKYFEVTAFRPLPNQFACIFIDITERKQAESEKEKLQTQLNQSQKLESIGRLAGGVAHDLNNMLSVIIGNTEMVIDQIDPSHHLFDELKEIMDAAKRSANLTRQLLTFARKQTIEPKVLDFNKTVEEMLKMLGRIIGEDIDLKWQPQNGLWRVKMDPSQIDQILANLCVNARDAINGVGSLTIKTQNIVLNQSLYTDQICYIDKTSYIEPICCNDKICSTDNQEAVTGYYVLLSVSDNGCGMDKEVMKSIFEPFFTTKEIGKGTGLGLSTVYGIVKQNNGFINVESILNEGTTFNIYIPRYIDSNSSQSDVEHLKIEFSSFEPDANQAPTILLVEDEPAILKLTKMILTKEGYKVVAAASPSDAVDIAKNYHGEIDLLITDVIMPQMNGRELAEKILSIYPNINLLFMSGYTADVIQSQQDMIEGAHFIQKPFSRKDLAAKLKDVM